MQTQGGKKDDGARRSPVEGQTVGTCGSKEFDQSETEAGTGYIALHSAPPLIKLLCGLLPGCQGFRQGCGR